MGFERGKKIIIRFLIVILVALIAFAGYILVTNNPKFKVKMAVKYVFNKIDSAMQVPEQSTIANAILDNKVELTNRITTKLSLNNDVLQQMGPAGKKVQEFINNSTITTNIKSDVPSKYMDFGLNYTYNNEPIKANAYLGNNQVYISLTDYFNKYLRLDPKDYSADEIFEQMNSNIKVDDIRYLTDLLKKSIVDSIEFGTITNSKTDIDIDEEKVAVNKTTLTIDTKLNRQIQIIFINKVLFDAKAKEIIMKLPQADQYKTVADLENDFRDQVVKLEQTPATDNKIVGEYTLYTQGVFNKIVRNEIKYFDSTNAILQYTTYNTAKFDTQITVFKDNKLITKVNIKELSENSYDINVNAGPDVSMDLKGVITDTLTDVTYTLRMSGSDDVKGQFRLETRKVNDKEMNQTLNLKLDTPESYGTANLTIDSTLKIVDNIVRPDFTNNVNIDSLTDEQMATIMTNFQSKNPKVIKAISEIFASLMGGTVTY